MVSKDSDWSDSSGQLPHSETQPIFRTIVAVKNLTRFTYPRTQEDLRTFLNYWDADSEPNLVETRSKTDNYESVIIGLVFFILCLLILAILLILGMFRIRRCRTRLAAAAPSLSVRQSHLAPASTTTREPFGAADGLPYIIGAPPSYQMDMEKCREFGEPPPSYEHIAQSELIVEPYFGEEPRAQNPVQGRRGSGTPHL